MCIKLFNGLCRYFHMETDIKFRKNTTRKSISINNIFSDEWQGRVKNCYV